MKYRTYYTILVISGFHFSQIVITKNINLRKNPQSGNNEFVDKINIFIINSIETIKNNKK